MTTTTASIVRTTTRTGALTPSKMRTMAIWRAVTAMVRRPQRIWRAARLQHAAENALVAILDASPSEASALLAQLPNACAAEEPLGAQLQRDAAYGALGLSPYHLQDVLLHDRPCGSHGGSGGHRRGRRCREKSRARSSAPGALVLAVAMLVGVWRRRRRRERASVRRHIRSLGWGATFGR